MLTANNSIMIEEDIMKKCKGFVFQLFDSKLPGKLCFHNKEHTQAVVDAVKQIADYENVSVEDKEILLIAAWFHDTGFTGCYDGHERESQQIAEKQLKTWGIGNEKIQTIKKCIAATRLPQNPANHLQAILCDADLFHLASEDYWKKNEKLKRELSLKLGKHISEDRWYLKNLKFLSEHTYFTNYGRDVLQPLKQKNIIKNIEKLEEII